MSLFFVHVNTSILRTEWRETNKSLFARLRKEQADKSNKAILERTKADYHASWIGQQRRLLSLDLWDECKSEGDNLAEHMWERWEQPGYSFKAGAALIKSDDLMRWRNYFLNSNVRSGLTLLVSRMLGCIWSIVFSPMFHQFVWFLVGLLRGLWTILVKSWCKGGGAWPREEPIQFWCRARSRNYVFKWLRDGVFFKFSFVNFFKSNSLTSMKKKQTYVVHDRQSVSAFLSRLILKTAVFSDKYNN